MTTYTKKFKEFIQEYNPDPNDYVVGYRKLDDSEIKIPLIAIDNSITAGKYLRRDIDDYANGLIGFRRGATFGSNVMSTIYLQGLTGWSGDADGNFEMNSLRIREFLEVPEIRKNKITVMGNQFWFTDSAMIETALPLGGNKYNVYFKLEDLEYASFELNDILKGIYHYDSGFYTVYLRVYELILNPDTAGEIGVRVESLNGQLPMQSMLLARMNNSSDKDRLGSVFVDGINKYLRVLDGYNPSKPTSEGDLSTLKVLLGDLSSIKGHPTFGDLEGYGAYLENAYVSGKIIVKNDPNRPGQELGVYRGLWNSVDTYYKYDQVTYKGSLYTSKQVGNTGNIPTGGVDDIWWELTVEKGGDGTSGLSNYTLELSNDNHTIPTDSNGDNPSYGGASSTAYVFEGTNDISNVYTITAKVQLPATGTTLLIVLNGNTATITYIDKSLDAATIMFTATAEGYPTLSKAWSISKVKSGDDATAYWLVTDSPIIKKLNNGLFLPDPFVIRAFSLTGAGDILPFDGYIKISYGSQVDVVSGAVYLFPPIADVKSYIIELYKDSQTSILLDKEIVSVVQDGVNQDWLLYIFKSSIGQPGTPTYTSPPNLYPTPEGWLDYPNDAVSIWWMSTSTVNGVTNAIAKWSTPVKVTGEDGANGKDAPWTDFKFKKNNDYNSAPSITPTDRFPTGWTDTVPVVLRGEYLWMTNAVINPDNSLKTTWSIPVRISGELGPQGERGEQGLTGKDGLQGPSIVFGGKWLSDRQYYCYADTQTAVFYNNRYYYTKAVSPAISPVTIPMGIGNNPSTAEGKVYWSEFAGQFDSVATGLLLAERIATAELTANKLFIVDRDESTGDIIAADGSKITKEQEKAMSSTQMIGLLTKGWFMDQGVIRSIAVLDDNTTPKLKLDSDGTIIATGVNVSGTVHFLDGTIANMQVFKDGRWTDTVNGPFPASNGAYYLRKNTGVTISPQGHIIGKDYFLTGDSTIGPSVFIGDVYVPGYTVPGLDNTSLSSFINLFNSLFEKVLVGSLYHIKAKLPLFSVGELTAYGTNSSTIPSIWDGIPVDKTTIDLVDGKLTVIGGTGVVDTLDSWVDYTPDKAKWALSALLGVDLNLRLITTNQSILTVDKLKKDLLVNAPKTGHVEPGVVFEKNTTYERVIRKILYKPIPAYLTSLIYVSNDVEIGTARSNILYTTNRKDNGPLIESYYMDLEDLRKELVFGSPSQNGDKLALVTYPGFLLKKETYRAFANYAEEIENELPSINLTSTISINVRRKWFAGKALSAPTNSVEVRDLPSSALIMSTSFKFGVLRGSKTICFSLPSEYTVSKITFDGIISNLPVSISEFVVTTVSVAGANDLEYTNYKVYTKTNDIENLLDATDYYTINF